jgi:hypothetical protein
MRASLLVLLATIPLVAADPNRLTPEEQRAGWKLLFDGKTPAGWLEITGKPFPATSWTIEDSALKAFPNPAGQQDIRTAAAYRNFEFDFEWKMLEQGNSGVKYMVQKVDEWTQTTGARQARARAPEFQLADDNGPDAGSNPSKSCGSLYSLIAPAPKPNVKLGAFNRSRLVVHNGHVEHWINGAKVVAYETTTPEVQKLFQSLRKPGEPVAFPESSPISLQNHGSPVWFQALKIRILD